jgi:hypothetical protein
MFGRTFKMCKVPFFHHTMNLLVYTHSLFYYVAGVIVGTRGFFDSMHVPCDCSLLCSAI